MVADAREPSAVRKRNYPLAGARKFPYDGTRSV